MARSSLHDQLGRAGARFEELDGWCMPHFGNAQEEYDAARNRAAFFDVSAATKIAVSGPDAAVFLHNFLTNDIKKLAVGNGCEAFLANHRARVIAHVAVSHVTWKGEDAFWLDTTPGQAERITQHLNRFIISEQVEIADRSADLAMLRVAGPTAPALLAQALQTTAGSLQIWDHFVCKAPVGEVLVRFQRNLGVVGYDCFCEPAAAAGLWDRLVTAGVTPAGVQTHETLRIEAGFPVFGRDMDENRFVVEVGRVDAISYTKGCYLGQEPIVMARDRGQVNRALLGVLAGAGDVLAPGTALMAGDTAVGEITSSAFSPRLKQVAALAYIRRGYQESGVELAITPVESGRKAVVSPLPLTM